MRAVSMLGLMVTLTAAGLSTTGLSSVWAAETVARDGIHQPVESRTFVGLCAPWDEAASLAISQLAQASPDVNIRLVSDSIAGMRRARRLCVLGSLTDACLEYDAVIRGVQRRLQAGAIPVMCSSVANGVPAF